MCIYLPGVVSRHSPEHCSPHRGWAQCAWESVFQEGWGLMDQPSFLAHPLGVAALSCAPCNLSEGPLGPSW